MAADQPQTPNSPTPGNHAPANPKPGATYRDPNREGDVYTYDHSNSDPDDPWPWLLIRDGRPYNWLAGDKLPEGLVRLTPADGEAAP